MKSIIFWDYWFLIQEDYFIATTKKLLFSILHCSWWINCILVEKLKFFMDVAICWFKLYVVFLKTQSNLNEWLDLNIFSTWISLKVISDWLILVIWITRTLIFKSSLPQLIISSQIYFHLRTFIDSPMLTKWLICL